MKTVTTKLGEWEVDEGTNVSHPIRWTTGATWVWAIAMIRKNDTGEVREYKTNEVLEPGADHPSVFNWEENNFSCDCNRALFFARVNGESEDFDRECTDGQFSVNLKNPVDGKIYYQEYEPS